VRFSVRHRWAMIAFRAVTTIAAAPLALTLTSALSGAVWEAQGSTAVVGSVGTTVWGLQRTAIDTDIITVAVDERIDELLAPLSGAQIHVPVDDARQVLRSGGSVNVLDLDTTEKIDVFAAPPNDPFTASRLSRRVKAQIEDVDTWVTTADDCRVRRPRGAVDA
jgi:hypothetical protein